MSSLSFQQRQSIQEFVKGILRDSLAGLTQAQLQLAENGDDPVTALAATVRCAVDEGITGFLEAHNERQSNLLVRLPLELVQTFFRLLDFRGRVAVSHVSRAWRRVALADCCLWNALTLRKTPPERVAIEMFETLLARAGGMPFEFAWASPTHAIPEALLALVVERTGRMRSLHLYTDPRNANARILRHKAPWLKHLATSDRSLTLLPVDWGTHWVPRLETLHLDFFEFPERFEPLPELRSLQGRLSFRSSIPTLSHAFPRLVKLELRGITQPSLPLFGAPPISCRTVRLRSGYGRSVDFSPFLQACCDHPIPFLSITGTDTIRPSVMEFAHVTRGPCRMVIYHDNMIRLECDEDGITRELSGADELPILAEFSCFASLHRLTELSLPLPLFFGLRDLRADQATVRSLTIVVFAPEHASLQSLLSLARRGSPLQMPRLEDITLDAHALEVASDDTDPTNLRWIADDFPGLFPSLLRMDRAQLEKLEVVLLEEHNVKQFGARLDLTALRSLTRVLRVRDLVPLCVEDFTDAA